MKNWIWKNMTSSLKRCEIKMRPYVNGNFMHTIGIRDTNTTMKLEKNQIKNGWHEINWKKAEEKVKDLQEKIVIATLENDFKKVYRLQWMIISCFEAQAIAIRRVITNQGGNTAGIDKIRWKSPKDYWQAIEKLSETVRNPGKYEATPLRRVWIPKPGSNEKRPLGIPTMTDRAVQALYHLGLDPVVETQSDLNSFGFRKNRSTHDAITAIRNHLDKTHHPRWILEADISKCFDKISHEFLMEHTHICHKKVLEQWLKSGIMEEMNLTETIEGTPQGGIISPTLCNIALNGIEKVIKKANPLPTRGKHKDISAGVHVIRYADDIIITGKTQEIAIKNKNILKEFLKERGLMLNEKKTKITNIKEGIDFLGFNIRRMKWRSRLNKDTEQETVLVIKPSEKGKKKLKESVRKIITMNKPIKKIISELNPVLRGWGEHKRISYHSQETFITIDNWIQSKMRKWAYWHKGSLRKTIAKHLVQTENRKWNWGISLKEKLVNLGEISIINITPLKLNKNPYIRENSAYYNKRKEKIIDAKFRSTIYKIYKQMCLVCGESLHNGERVELHHIIPVKSKGKYKVENIVPLHQICHQQITHGNRKSLNLYKEENIKKRMKWGTRGTNLFKIRTIG